MADKTISLYKGEVKIDFKESNHSYWITGDDGKKKRLSGVTTYCGVLDKSQALLPWAVRTTIEYVRDHLDDLKKDPTEILELARQEADKQKNLAAELGKAIHAWVESHIKDEEPEMPEDPRVLTGVNAFLSWVSENKVKFLESEKVVYSKKYNYVGTLDIKAKVNGKLCLLDIKTGNGIYAEAYMQTAAYVQADAEETGDQYVGRWILRLSKETAEEYEARMQKKGLTKYKPYQVFEAVYLDAEPDAQQHDFAAFVNAKSLFEWRKEAEKK